MKLIARYKRHTPIFWRKVGDSILLFGTTLVTLFASYNYPPPYIIGATLFGTFGKILTNLATGDEPEPAKPDGQV